MSTIHRRFSHLKASSVDWAYLARELYAICRARRVSVRAAGEEMGIHDSQLSRLQHARPLSVDGLATLLAWLYPDNTPAWITKPGHPEDGP